MSHLPSPKSDAISLNCSSAASRSLRATLNFMDLSLTTLPHALCSTISDNIGIGEVVGFFEGSVLKLKDRLPINDTNDLPNCKIWSKGVYDT